MACRIQCRAMAVDSVGSPMTMILSLVTTLWSLLELVTGQTQAMGKQDADNETVSIVAVVNVTDTPNGRCSSPRTCDSGCGGTMAGAVVGSLIAGLLVGALAMYVTQIYLKKRRRNIPPKDYTETQSSALDVNMNNGETTAIDSDDVTPTPDGTQVKGHKKLERLSKHGPKPIPGPKPMLGLKGKPTVCSSVETPLIYIGPKHDKTDNSDDPASTSARSSNSSNSGQSALTHQSSRTSGNSQGGGEGDGGPSGNDADDDVDSDQGNLYQDIEYTNIGLDAALSQPYDALDAIPEEVEYANTQEYEQLGLVPRS